MAAAVFLFTQGDGIVGSLTASGAVLGMIVGPAVSVNQQRWVTPRMPLAWITGQVGIWWLGSLLYWGLYQGLGGFLTTSINREIVRPAEDGAYIWRAVIIGWVVMTAFIALATTLWFTYTTDTKSPP